ncbi:MAG: hypothetical protein IGR93_11320 [Hydrococcus sp. C42_A2020_068]|nr:hypothetical protein [Hydrococcus sp. C42_A2020_068]
MSGTSISTANLLRHRAISRCWHRHQSQCQILRAQLGFDRVESSRPLACQGCRHYHGKAYGLTRTTRIRLICGFHPYGWMEKEGCPDWQGENESIS